MCSPLHLSIDYFIALHRLLEPTYMVYHGGPWESMGFHGTDPHPQTYPQGHRQNSNLIGTPLTIC
jgi:hypothetical protein